MNSRRLKITIGISIPDEDHAEKIRDMFDDAISLLMDGVVAPSGGEEEYYFMSSAWENDDD